MRKIVITGGPSTGKSTLFKQLEVAFPDAYFIDEAAERVIKRELAKQADDHEYVPKIPATNYREFEPLLTAQQLQDESDIPPDAQLVFMDRCLIDNLGYLAYNHLDDLAPEVERQARLAAYTMAFICEPLSSFKQTEVRHETSEQGLAIHQQLKAAYDNFGLDLVHLPAIAVEERVKQIQKLLT